MRSVRALRVRLDRWRRAVRRSRMPVRRLAEPRPSHEVTVSIVVPVKNAGPELGDLIGQMKDQKGFRAVEVVIVDSGSTDGSAETAEALGATLVRIAPEGFSHSYARNLGAERASGDYVLFTVQDALPSSDHWLQEMFSGLQRHEAAAVSCGEEPRPDSDLFYRVISWNHERFMSVDGGDTVLVRPASDDPLDRRRNAQLSDTACLMARGLFLGYRHRGNYAEDLDLGLRLTDDGYRLAFLGSTHIVHSHNRPAYYHLKRSYVEHLALFDMVRGYPTVPGDGAAVIQDIVCSCAAMDALVADGLGAVVTPWSLQQVREAVAAAPRPAGSTDASVPGRDYLDGRTREVVNRLCSLAEHGASDPAEGSLFRSVSSVAQMICDYLQHSGESLDAGRLDEFKAALYKGWALHCGVRLASAWWRGSDVDRESLRALHDELTREV